METMTIDRYLEDIVAQNVDYDGEEKWKSISDTAVDSNDSAASGFDCNICLDSVEEPVVTLCGHLYCWPCIYKWLHLQRISAEDEGQQEHQHCPVCKAEVSEATVVPLFCRGQTAKRSKSVSSNSNLGIMIPQRPLGFACGLNSPRPPIASSSLHPTQRGHPNYPQQPRLYYSDLGSYHASPILAPDSAIRNTSGPMIGMLGEMIYARVFGNSISNIYAYPNSYNAAGSNTPRLRRYAMQADKSLGRVCLFLFCCAFLCLLLF